MSSNKSNISLNVSVLFATPLKSRKSHPGRLTHVQLGSHLFVYLFFSPVIIKIQENTVKVKKRRKPVQYLRLK